MVAETFSRERMMSQAFYVNAFFVPSSWLAACFAAWPVSQLAVQYQSHKSGTSAINLIKAANISNQQQPSQEKEEEQEQSQ